MRNAALALLAFAATAFAQQPRIVHGTVTSVAAAADLGAQIRGARTRYIGYAVPEVDGEWVMCCLQSYGEFRSGGTCSLDRDGSSFTNNDHEELHPASGVIDIFYRVENGEIARVRGYSMECVLDAGGTAMTWIEGVDPRKSVAFIVSILNGPGHHSDNLMAMLAMHADPLATAEMERMLRSTDAAFWLGQKHDPRALAAIEEMLRK
jgi:hypothetical protein